MMQLQVVTSPTEMHQNSPTAIEDLKNFAGEKPTDPRF